jgi:hypothetical protein
MDIELSISMESFMHRFHGSRKVRQFNRGLVAGIGRCVVVSAAFLASPAIGFAGPPVPWSKLPRMELERQFAGPLQDTIIQRWRDPADGTVCYIYLPITAQHSSPTESGYVQYGPNIIGTMSCLKAESPPARPAQAPAEKKKERAHAGAPDHR